MYGIELRNISLSFDNKEVLHNISLSVNEGEMISLLGPSGCGKTTTLKAIAGLAAPDSGDILLKDQSVLNVPVEKRGAVIVFQDYLLFPHMTVEENIGFGLKMAGVKKDRRLDKVREMVNLVQLNGYEKKYPHELSGGQKQRTALARALAVEPKVLLLDEPFSNLDQRLRETMREFVWQLQRKMNITTILVTHDKEEALMLSDRVAVMLDGSIEQFDTPDEIYKKPASSKVADFFGETNYINGRVEDGVFRCFLGEFVVSLCDSLSLRAMIRPEDVEIFKCNGGEISGVVKRRRYAGNRVYYAVLIDGVEVKALRGSDEMFEVGEAVGVRVNFDSAVFYSGEGNE